MLAGSGTGPSWMISPWCTTTARETSGCSGSRSWETRSLVQTRDKYDDRAHGHGCWVAGGLRVDVGVVRFCSLAGRLRYRSIVDDLAVVHHDRPGDQRVRRAEFVGDQEYGAAARHERGECVGERLLAGRVDTGGRLVE